MERVPQQQSSLLEARLRAVEDRFEILDLEARYATAWDSGDADAWACLFTADGIFDMRPYGGEGGTRFVGRDALRTFCQDTTASWTGLHFLHPPQLAIDGDSARATVFFEYRFVARGRPDVTRQGVTGGHYAVTYARTGDGWRMRERIETPVYMNWLSFFDMGRIGPA